MPSIADLDALFERVFGCSDSRSEVASLYSALWAGPQTVLDVEPRPSDSVLALFYCRGGVRVHSADEAVKYDRDDQSLPTAMRRMARCSQKGVLMLYFSIDSSQAHFERGSAVIHVARSRPSTLLYGLGLRQSLV
ncbi:hypothetical protein C8J56DRAFT_892211 [Mycena floridula]|nr:hypothetical protein C8J56DRAFT_892211 [Mycena floridula]